MKNINPLDDRGVYREVYCPHCKRKFMEKCYYDYMSEDGTKEYADAMCTTCRMFLYAEKGVLEGIGTNTERPIVSKYPGIILR